MAGDRVAGLLLLLAFLVIIWVVEVVNAFTGHSLNVYGILPRTVEGLRGIPLSPFLHGGFGHLLSNTLPLLALGGLAALRGRGRLPDRDGLYHCGRRRRGVAGRPIGAARRG